YVFSSGDHGSWSASGNPWPQYPPSSRYVTGVGGSHFNGNIGSGWPGEDAWPYTPGNPPIGSGGGYSISLTTPSWQVAPGFSNSHRGIPDVSADADPNTG